MDSDYKNIETFDNYLSNFDIILSKNKIQTNYLNNYHNYIYDKFGKINPINQFSIKKYYLYSKIKLLEDVNQIKIGGIGLLKNLDLYPFDICFESVLDFVEEFIIGIDEKSFNKEYEKILDNYLNQTKYKNKIKTIFLILKQKQQIIYMLMVDGLQMDTII